MNAQQSQLVSRALASLYQVELLQNMAKASDNAMNEYPIHEYAYILDKVLYDLKVALNDLDDNLHQNLVA